MAHDEQGAFGAVPLEPRDDIRPGRLFRRDDVRDTFGIEDLSNVVDHARFVARRIGRVDLDECLKVAHRLAVHLGPVRRLRGCRKKRDQQEERYVSHLKSVARPSAPPDARLEVRLTQADCPVGILPVEPKV